MEHVDVVVIGAGPSGIGAAVRLRAAGRTDLVVLEKGDGPGGTWRENRYPGVACDVPSTLYSYSFAPNPEWSRAYSGGEEICRYLQGVIERHDLAPVIRYGTEVLRADWDAGARRWTLDTTGGPVSAKAVISAAGPLHEPSIPDVPGLADFTGTTLHTARWDASLDLRGRRVAVVGTGASAIQLIPRLAAQGAELTVIQRTPAWVLPKPDRPTLALERTALRVVPGLNTAIREVLYHGFELVQLAQRRPRAMREVQRLAELHLRVSVRDPDLREALRPDFVLGCKRILMSNSYYGALQRENVTVVPHALTAVTADGVRTADGGEHAVDAIVFATGFEATDPPIAHRVRGADGRSLGERWDGSPRAYRGTMVAGFPNLMLLIGPNTGNGHSSAFVVLEAQLVLVLRILDAIDAAPSGALAPTAAAEAAWDAQVQEALAGTVWNAGGCSSWYIDRQGRNSSIYPWTTIDLRRRCAELVPGDFAEVAEPAVLA